jgi:hypothetical protein
MRESCLAAGRPNPWRAPRQTSRNIYRSRPFIARSDSIAGQQVAEIHTLGRHSLGGLRADAEPAKITVMNPFFRKLIWVRFAIVAVLAWSLTATIALAATAAGAPGADSGKSYVVSYFLVVLATALGLIIVCRSSNRSNELRRSEDDD